MYTAKINAASVSVYATGGMFNGVALKGEFLGILIPGNLDDLEVIESGVRTYQGKFLVTKTFTTEDGGEINILGVN